MKKQGRGWRDSYIVRFFIYLTNLFYGAVEAGLFGRVMTSYDAGNRLFSRSLTHRAAVSVKATRSKWVRSVRRSVALAMNQSLLNRLFSGALLRFCRYSLRTYGAFCVTAGAYSAVMYWLFSVVWQSNGVEMFHLFSGTALLLIGVLLLFPDVSFGFALSKGLLFNRVLVPLLGVPEEALRNAEREGKHGYAIAVPLGMAVGALSALTSPFYLLAALIAFLLIYLVMSIPEAGVVLLLLALPFVGFLPNAMRWLLLLAGLPLISYLGKLLRGKRALHMELLDLPVLLMLIVFSLSAVSVAGDGFRGRVLASVLFIGIYFLVINVIATPHWQRRCRTALVLSASACALVAVAQFLLAVLRTGVLSIPLHSALVHAGFTDQTTCAYYLVLAFPFALIAFAVSVGHDRLLSGFALVVLPVAALLTWVHSAVIAMLVMLLLFLLMYRRYSFPFVLLGGAAGITSFFTLPAQSKARLLDLLRSGSGAVVGRTLSAGNLVGRIFFEKGSGLFARSAGLSRLFFGLGSGGVERFCLLYTSFPAAEVAQSFNFWLYLLLENGVLGVLLPAVFFFLFCQNCFSLLQSNVGQEVRLICIAGVLLMTGVLLMSLFRYAWYDPSAMLAFFVAAGLVAAITRCERARIVSAMQMERVEMLQDEP